MRGADLEVDALVVDDHVAVGAGVHAALGQLVPLMGSWSDPNLRSKTRGHGPARAVHRLQGRRADSSRVRAGCGDQAMSTVAPQRSEEDVCSDNDLCFATTRPDPEHAIPTTRG